MVTSVGFTEREPRLVSFSRDGSALVVGNMNQKNMQVFKNDNGKLTDTGQTIDTVGGAAAVRASTDR